MPVVVSLMLLGGMCLFVKFGRKFLSQQWSDKMPLAVSLGFQIRCVYGQAATSCVNLVKPMGCPRSVFSMEGSEEPCFPSGEGPTVG